MVTATTHATVMTTSSTPDLQVSVFARNTPNTHGADVLQPPRSGPASPIGFGPADIGFAIWVRRVPFKRDHLRYFVTVAEEGQVTRAATKLHMAQPALSHAIAQLETELGIKLFERTARGVTLSPAGEQLYQTARRAVAAADDATVAARTLGRAATGTVAFGFLGAPPGQDSPEALQAFAEAYPGIEIRFHELPFPTLPTSAWLSDVDVAVCHLPPPDPQVWTMTLRAEPRAVLAPVRHPLAERHELSVAEVIDETFIGFHPSVAPAWAGFWSLDDHRGGPPGRITGDRVANPQEVAAALVVRRAITVVPASVGKLLGSFLREVVAIPLRDAAPALITLAGHEGQRNPLVAVIRSFARDLNDATLDMGPAAGAS